VFDLAAVMRGGALLSWQPERGTRIAFIPRDGDAVRWVDTDPFWVWHFANAFDNPDGTVTIDYRTCLPGRVRDGTEHTERTNSDARHLRSRYRPDQA